jgi:hypothetical protein
MVAAVAEVADSPLTGFFLSKVAPPARGLPPITKGSTADI